MILFHTIRFSCNLQPHHSAFINPPSPSSLITSLISAMAASAKLYATTILMLSLLAFSTFTEACGSCKPPKPKPKPKPCPTPAPPQCPLDTLKLGVCADILGLVNVVVGSPPTSKCCPLLEGLADIEAALCLCTAINANVLGINLNIPLSLSLILSSCQKSVPPGFQCPSH